MKWWKCMFLMLTAFLLIAATGVAEDLRGADKVLCAGVQATYCDTTGDCEIGMPWNWGMPHFVEIHLGDRMIRTTPAAERPRQTPIRTLEREGGKIYLQGVENGRAFSFVIDELSGVASIAIAADGLTVSVFGACTPMPGNE